MHNEVLVPVLASRVLHFGPSSALFPQNAGIFLHNTDCEVKGLVVKLNPVYTL